MMKWVSGGFAVWIAALSSVQANAQFLVDTDSDTMKKAVGTTTLDDLSINDTALVYRDFCVRDNKLFLPGWSKLADLASNTYASTGVILKLTILPGKRVSGTYVDAAQAQSIAKGNSNAPPVLSKSDYEKAVLDEMDSIYRGGFWGTLPCDQEQESNPLRPLKLLEVDAING
ncbi:MAG: hypothetical protein E5V60_15625, partial [Mesorhizobium sp.]